MSDLRAAGDLEDSAMLKPVYPFEGDELHCRYRDPSGFKGAGSFGLWEKIEVMPAIWRLGVMLGMR